MIFSVVSPHSARPDIEFSGVAQGCAGRINIHSLYAMHYHDYYWAFNWNVILVPFARRPGVFKTVFEPRTACCLHWAWAARIQILQLTSKWIKTLKKRTWRSLHFSKESGIPEDTHTLPNQCISGTLKVQFVRELIFFNLIPNLSKNGHTGIAD